MSVLLRVLLDNFLAGYFYIYLLQMYFLHHVELILNSYQVTVMNIHEDLSRFF